MILYRFNQKYPKLATSEAAVVMTLRNLKRRQTIFQGGGLAVALATRSRTNLPFTVGQSVNPHPHPLASPLLRSLVFSHRFRPRPH